MTGPEGWSGDRSAEGIDSRCADASPAATVDWRLPVSVCLLLAGICLLAGLVFRPPPIANRDPSLLALLKTAAAATALAGAWTLRVCYRHSRLLRDLLLLAAVATLGLADLLGALLPGVLAPASLLLILPVIALSASAAARFAGTPDPGERLTSACFGAGFGLSAVGLAGWLAVAPAGSGVVPWPVPVKLLGACLLALGALRQSAFSRREEVAARVTAERRRLARELHDGLCQDLAFIVANASRFLADDGTESPVMIAARRALAFSRETLSELSASHVVGTPEALRTIAEELELRFGIEVSVRTNGIEFESHDREDIVRIVREAIVNAARHGAARKVIVELQREDGAVVLRIRDDGLGLPAADRRREGFGMRSMRERSVALGGQLDARSHTDGGAELELMLP